MDAVYSLLKADDVKTFPSIQMPSAKKHQSPRQDIVSKKKSTRFSKSTLPSRLTENDTLLPSVLKGSRPPTTNIPSSELYKSTLAPDTNIFAGFDSSNLQYDSYEHTDYTVDNKPNKNKLTSKRVATVDLAKQTELPPNEVYITSKISNMLESTMSMSKDSDKKSDKVIGELKNYLQRMDQYSVHNFIIYNGRTLRDSPEFKSLKETYFHAWGPMTHIITQLESFVTRYNIRMAVIDGPQVYKLSLLNLGHYEKDEILSCIANSEQIKPHLNIILTSSGIEQFNKIVIKIQSLIRRFLAKKRLFAIKSSCFAIIKIQANFRRRKFMNSQLQSLSKDNRVAIDDKWKSNSEKLKAWWRSVPEYAEDSNVCDPGNAQLDQKTGNSMPINDNKTFPMVSSRKRLLIHIPSLSTSEYIRLSMENLPAVQNMHISCLYQLIDPDVHIVYISPVRITVAEITFYEKYLSVLGVPLIPKRIHFVVPELINRLPNHISIAQLLLCSTGALSKIKFYMARIPNAMIIPTSLSWVEKRLVNFLNIPMLSPEPIMSVTLQSRSFLKKHFQEAGINIPLGYMIYTLLFSAFS